MELRSLRVLHEAGTLTAAVAVPVEEKSWTLTFERSNGVVTTLGTAREPARAKIFKSLDAVVSAAEEIGFLEVKAFTRKRAAGDNKEEKNMTSKN